MSTEDLIKAYLEQLRLTGRSPYTTYEWGLLLRRADAELEFGLEGAGELELQQWINRTDWSPNTRSAYDACLRSFYRYACSSLTGEEGLEDDPMVNIPPPRKQQSIPRPCPDDALAIMLEKSREPYRTWFVLAAFGALRCIEISRLDREHVTVENMRLLGKGDKRRVVPTHELIWAAVRDLPPGPVARNREGERMQARYVSRNAWTYLRDGLGIQGVSMHMLRHWCLSGIQREFRNLRVTQEIAGHSSPATTAVYTLVDDEQRRAAIRGLHLPTDGGAGRSGAGGEAGASPTP